TSSRFILFDETGEIAAIAQKEHAQICPRPGWVEHDAAEIWRNTRDVIGRALEQANVEARDVAAVGITNQRETVVLWDADTGAPLANAIVWQDTRVADDVRRFADEGGLDRFRAKTGLPLATYFSALKLRWLLDHVDGLEPDRRPAGRASRDGRHECEPHAADESSDARLGRRAARGLRHSPQPPAADRVVERGVRPAARAVAASPRAARRHPRRSA